jgi:S-adenosylmethionine hydrolase
VTERPIITMLTDFGLDGAVAACKGVILSICRDAQIVDVAHTIRKYSIRDGAWIMRAVLPYQPVGTHVGVVDPGVGTPRLPIGIRTGRGDALIGPDNGLLVPPAEVLGGISAARVLDNRDLWLPVTTSTFHGRDIFSPVAAHLAAGDAPFEEVGSELNPDDLVRLSEPAPVVRAGSLETEVIYVDSFGNIRLAGSREAIVSALGDLADRTVAVEFAEDRTHGPIREATRFRPTFGAVEIGGSLLYVDSSGNLALADNQGSAAARLGITPGCAVRITLA